MTYLQTSTGPVAYDERGDCQPIVLLTSGAHDHHDYDALCAMLPPRFRSVSLDWPAHGDSPPGEGPASAMRFADIAEELVEALAADGAVVVGNSVGGFAAARLAIRRPELVRGLVIVDGGGFGGRPPWELAFCALMSRRWFLRRVYPAFSSRYMRPRTDADRRARDTGVATTRRDPGLQAVSELWHSFASAEHDLRDDAPSIKAPTLMIWGRDDPVIPVRIAERAVKTIPGARLVVMESGHVPYTTDPEGFAAQLIPFADAAFSRSAQRNAHARIGG